MTTIVTSTIVDGKIVKENVDIDTNNGLTVLVHQQGIKVEVPEFVEIDPQDTIRCMNEMTQPQWEWISEGDLFKTLWKEAFNPVDLIDPPKLIEVLNMGDLGFRHVAGMIVLGCEAFMASKSVFVRNPETYLHPRTEQHIVRVFIKMLELFGKSGKVKVSGYTRKDGTVVEPYERTVKIKRLKTDPAENINQTLVWLEKLMGHYGPTKEIFQIGDERKTIVEMVEEVKLNSQFGQQFVEMFVEKRDGLVV